MAFMKRLSGVVQAKANKVLDRVEDPRDTLDLSYEKQLEQLQQVRKGIADVATARKRIELQAQQLQASAAKLQNQARQALAQNREDLAREALTRRAAIATQLEGLKTQHDQLVGQEERLVGTTQQLQARVEAFRTQKETLKASYTAAEAQTKIGEAVSGISESMSDTGMAMQRAQDKISQMQARAGAVDELLSSGALTDLSGASDPLQAELDKASQGGQVDLELAQLKSESAPSGQLTAGDTPADDEATDAEVVKDDKPKDLFSLEGGRGFVIVRILQDGQYELDDKTFAVLTAADEQLEKALGANDEARFAQALNEAVAIVHSSGRALDAQTIVPSDLALPALGATLEEVREFIASES